MDQGTEHKVRERAYALWQKEGSPHGRDLEFWERARLMLESEASPPAATPLGQRSTEERAADEAVKESFPASDPPAFTADVGAGAGQRGGRAGQKR